MKYEFHPEALEEFQDAAVRYTEKQPGLEHRFIASVEAAIGRIAERPPAMRFLSKTFGAA